MKGQTGLLCHDFYQIHIRHIFNHDSHLSIFKVLVVSTVIWWLCAVYFHILPRKHTHSFLITSAYSSRLTDSLQVKMLKSHSQGHSPLCWDYRAFVFVITLKATWATFLATVANSYLFAYRIYFRLTRFSAFFLWHLLALQSISREYMNLSAVSVVGYSFAVGIWCWVEK